MWKLKRRAGLTRRGNRELEERLQGYVKTDSLGLKGFKEAAGNLAEASHDNLPIGGQFGTRSKMKKII